MYRCQNSETDRDDVMSLAPGAAEAASEHALLLLPGLRLLRQQRAEIAKRLRKLLDELASPDDAGGEAEEHRDAEVLLSLPGVGRFVAATMLSEASQAIADRDYHALRCYAGVSTICDPRSRSRYAQLRARGHSHGRSLRGIADRWLRVLVSMLRHGTLYDPVLKIA